jgi:MFS family permease
VYQIETSSRILQTGRKLLARGPSRLRVSANVLFLGLTSLFTDISSEMVTSVLPLYMLMNLSLTPMAFGVVDGLYLGSAAVVRLVGGYLADRTGRYKSVAFAGYALSMVSRIGLLAFGSVWGWLLGIVLIDRLGKGIRSDSRDALISFSTPTSELGTAFGVHRALDTAGAMIGPLVAFGILMLAPDAFDAVFVVSLCAALIGLAILVLFVDNRLSPATEQPQRAGITTSAVARLLRRPDVLALVVAGGALNLATLSDAFFYLTLQRRLEFQPGFFPLLYVATAAVFMVLALPMGLVADRIGRTRVFLGSYLLLLLAYATLLLPPGIGLTAASLLLLGCYYAGTDGVLMALASSRLPADLRTSGMALLMTVVNFARLAASILFGWLWTWRGVEFAVGVFGGCLVVAIVLARLLLDSDAQGTRAEGLVTP